MRHQQSIGVIAPGLGRFGLERSDPFRPDRVRFGLVRPDRIRFGLVRPDRIRFGLVRPDLVCFDFAQTLGLHIGSI
ncbi:hypothetical protein [Candidatus Magnetaquiglobus chichijimensis]|uniref:hypothetical protein n=1 Tax=Candidatus Magnetaquiglobus chichijimensis TaxID=3141448 RepID=UPI003B96FA07